MAKRDGEQDQLIGQLPGTGGDFIDDNDVEGHRQIRSTDDAIRRDGEPDGLYRGGPTTQGEVIRRGPGDNPHGER